MNWDKAYALQARSDLEAREHLVTSGRLPECHGLHYVQMACEKLCKAYLAKRGSTPETLRKSHAFISKVLPTIVQQTLSREAGRFSKNTWVVSAIGKLARQIELLAPSVDDAGRTPANCEYPWLSQTGEITVPARYNFGLTLLHEKAGMMLLKVLRSTIDELLSSDEAND